MLVLPHDCVIEVKRGFRMQARCSGVAPLQSCSRECDMRTPGKVRYALPRCEHPLLDLLAYRKVDIAEERALIKLDSASMVPVGGGGQELCRVTAEVCTDRVTIANERIRPEAVQPT